MPDLKYWLGFNLVKGIGPAKLQALLDYFGSLRHAWQATEWQLQQIGIDQRAIQAFLAARSTVDLDAELARTEKAGIHLLTWEMPEYPRYLREIPNSPPVLYLNGQLSEVDQWAVAVVGTRRLTSYGRQVTHDLVAGLVRHNVTVVSGLARGIDAVAHKTALEMGGRTIAVLGSGLDCIYPAENRTLAKNIVDGHGAVISEYALGVQPEAKNFPPRNRVISGLSLGVIVVEAGEESGALITANFALEQDREVFAVPGNITSPASKGTNRLIQQGAKLVGSVEDVLEELNLALVPERQAIQLALPESAEEVLLLSLLSHQPVHVDELSREAGLSSAVVSSTLTLMELKGMVQQVGGMNYVLGREPDPVYEVNKQETVDS
ncbi:MAG: DNA-processing protein DprA [Chloroflexi bacterium]|nr:DNA-processing protein DprA [Chloroflexota bacterium]MCI0579237.1 DNA-processing protein DprA [Chloroflexota bacterium]MCI0725868.1 DNA-processing protein DprA [Chloroflexota bacterium]